MIDLHSLTISLSSDSIQLKVIKAVEESMALPFQSWLKIPALTVLTRKHHLHIPLRGKMCFSDTVLYDFVF